MRDEFSTFDISKALGIPKGRLREWIIADFVKPTMPADGPGTRAVFTRNDVYAVELFRHLVNSGFKRDMSASIVMNCGNYDLISEYKTLHVVTYSKGEKTEISGYMNAISVYDSEKLPQELKEKDELLRKLMKKYDKNGDKKIYEQIEDLETELFGYADKYGYPKFFEPYTMVEAFFNSSTEFNEMEWDNYYIINFEKIRRKVDMALSGLE